MGTKPTRGPASPMPSHTAMIARKIGAERALFISAKGAYAFIALHPDREWAHVQPAMSRGQLTGYNIIMDHEFVTEEDVQCLTQQ